MLSYGIHNIIHPKQTALIRSRHVEICDHTLRKKLSCVRTVKLWSFTCVSQPGQPVFVYLWALVLDVGRGVKAVRSRLRVVIAVGKKLLLWQVVLHWCTRTVFQRIRCQIGACLAEKSASSHLVCCPFLFPPIRAYRSVMEGGHLRANHSTPQMSCCSGGKKAETL